MKPKKTILCVDDNEQALSIRKVLLETRGYRVIACNSGEQALEAFRRGGVDRGRHRAGREALDSAAR